MIFRPVDNVIEEIKKSSAKIVEIHKLAVKSGLSYLLLGIETPSRESLVGTEKGFLEVDRVKSQIEKLYKSGVMVDSAMLFGFENHTKAIFDETINYINEIDLDVSHGVIRYHFRVMIYTERFLK